MKKTIVLLFILIAPVFIYVSCCNCPKNAERFYSFVGITSNVYGSNNSVINEGVAVTVDSVFLSFNLFTQCVAVKKSFTEYFINSAYACSCESCGYKGLKNKIYSIVITSDSAFIDIPANNILNDLFLVIDRPYYNYRTPISIDSLKTLFNQDYRYSSEILLFTKAKPTTTKGHRFTIRVETVDGKTITTTTKRITWL